MRATLAGRVTGLRGREGLERPSQVKTRHTVEAEESDALC